MSITVTSLTHPTMIAKIRAAMYYASKGEGHKMGGHDKRCYIQNSKGHNIMRLNWVGGKDGIIVYGCESRNITAIVKKALYLAKVSVDRKLKTESYALAYGAKHNPSLSTQAYKLAALAGMGLALTGCQAAGAMTVLFSVLGGILT